MADKLPIDDPRRHAEAAKKSDKTSQASSNKRGDDANAGITDEKRSSDEGRTSRDPDQPGRMKNDTAVRQQEELRSERDRGYGSEYIGDEYKDVKVEDKGEDEEAA